MKVTVLTHTSDALHALKQTVQWAAELRFAYAWMTRGPQWDELRQARTIRGVVGLHFAQTDPKVIQHFLGTGKLKVVAAPQGVFHPKVLVALADAKVQVLLGSSNATRGGFGKNTEINVLLEGANNDPEISKLVAFVESQWKCPDARFVDAPWLEEYKMVWGHQRTQQAITVPGPKVAPQPAQASDLNITWPRYFELISDSPLPIFDDERSYLWEVRQARGAFREHGRFAHIPEDLRRTIAGVGKRSGYFGGMDSAVQFKLMVDNEPGRIGEHLDRLPLDKPINKNQARNCLNGLCALHGIAVKTASRLMALKRPDRFLPINYGNRLQIARLFETEADKVETYLKLHAQLWAYPWARADAEPPDDPIEHQVWQARVAILDAILYTPKSET